MMARVRRVFLGWQRPILHSAVTWLLAEFEKAPVPRQLMLGFAEQEDIAGGTGGSLTSSVRARPGRSRTQKSSAEAPLTIVLPVSRAVVRLEQLLANAWAGRCGDRPAPRIITVGQLPEELYEPQRELAGQMLQTLAWTKVLLEASDSAISELVAGSVKPLDIGPVRDLAETLHRLCEDLAADAVSPSDVIDAVESEFDKRRWRQISNLHNQYLKTLRDSGFSDVYEQRRLAIAEKRCRTNGQIVLLGCVDVGAATCEMLDAVADQVTVLIGAPPNSADLFDSYGRVAPGRWNDFHVDITEEDLYSAGDASDQVALAASLVQGWNDSQTASTTVGIPESNYGAMLETELQLCNLTTHLARGIRVSETAPGRLLSLIGHFLHSRTWDSLAALIRHADVLARFSSECGSFKLLGALDAFRSTYFPVYVDGRWPKAARGNDDLKIVQQCVESVLKWLEPLNRPAMRIAEWCIRIDEILSVFYSHAIESEFAELQQQYLSVIKTLLQKYSTLPHALDLSVSVSVVIDTLLQRLSEPRVLFPPASGAIEIAGWLELALDDAQQLIVVGLNHPYVPQSITADPFLPGSLRTRLNIADNERRFARDLYILQAIYASRNQRCFIVGQASPDGSPTPPSRLLAACPSTVTLRRIKWLLEPITRDFDLRTKWDCTRADSFFPLPVAESSEPPSVISVTAFRMYLECPFRFYLRYILGIRPLDDSASELAANQFGDLIHAAAERFGKSADRDLTQAKHIKSALLDHLHQYVRETYGKQSTAAVKLQVAQAERRLAVLAERQSERAAAGWKIHNVEVKVEPGEHAAIVCEDGRKLHIRGRIDRIDYHSDSGTWAILDYKTNASHPLAKHYCKSTQTWTDLQLPLYLMLLPAIGIKADFDQVQIGYFNIPDKAVDCKVQLLELEKSMRDSAFAAARNVVSNILDGSYIPQRDPTAIAYDDYSMIMQTGIADRLMSGLDADVLYDGEE